MTSTIARRAGTYQEQEQEPYGEEAFRREVGGRIRAERSLRNLRQDELAQRAGVSRNFVSAVERGTQRLDAWRLLHLARALDCELGWLLDEGRRLPHPRG